MLSDLIHQFLFVCFCMGIACGLYNGCVMYLHLSSLIDANVYVAETHQDSAGIRKRIKWTSFWYGVSSFFIFGALIMFCFIVTAPFFTQVFK